MITENIQAVREAIKNACLQVKRAPEEITLIAISKSRSPEEILQAYHAGIYDFGENRVDEALRKQALLPKDIRWHFIGRLQTNKAIKAVGHFSLIHSVASYKLAEKLSTISTERNCITKVLLQMHTGEETKQGFLEEELFEAYTKITKLSHLEVKGLMTMAPKIVHDIQEVTASFQKARDFFERIRSDTIDTLSMGMSQDFVEAIFYGATHVRVGSKIFNQAS